jgi:uncharacterized protein (TIGR02594 family)
MIQNPVIAALSFWGERPISGKNANAQILKFISATTYPDHTSDEVPWCSAFLVWIFKECGIKTPANAAALSWINYSVPTDQPSIGDVVILKWATGAHVGLFVRETTDSVYVLAGNQNDTVDISCWRKRSVLSYRKLA